MTNTTDHGKRYEFYSPYDADQPKWAANSLGAIQGVTGIRVSELKTRCYKSYPRGKVVVPWRIVDLNPDKRNNCYLNSDKAIPIQQSPVNP